MKLKIRATANGHSMEEEARQILRSTLEHDPIYSIQYTQMTSSTNSLEEQLLELEKQGIWVNAKDPDTRITVGEPAPGALERFLADR